MMERPPTERQETHRIAVRCLERLAELRYHTARVALEYGTHVSVLADPERSNGLAEQVDSTLHHVTEDPAAWADDSEFYEEEYRASLPDDRETTESLLRAGLDGNRWPFTELAVHTEKQWLYRMHSYPHSTVARVNVSPVGKQYEDDLRKVARERNAMFCPLATLAQWTDSERWYEITGGHLCIYPEDVTGKSWEERQKFTAHGEYDVVGISRIHVAEAAMTVELSWSEIEEYSRFMRGVGAVIGAIGAVLQIPDAPTEMTFDSRSEFETAVDALLRAVGESY